MWFGYNCLIIFYHFFHFVNLVIFRPQCMDSGYLVSATQLFSPWSEDVHMVFGYNPCFYFCYFFHFANFVIF